MKRITTLFALVGCALVGGPRSAAAQTATIYGQLGNFDVVNDTGHETHGFEVELEGITPQDVYYTFSMQRYGAPEILPSPLGVYVRWKSLYNDATHTYNQTTVAHAPGTPFAGTCYQWNTTTYDIAGCEHFGVSLRVGSPKATYRWFVDDVANPGTLVAVDPPTAVAQPYYYIAPPQPAAPAVVVVEVQAPEPAEAPERYGDAQWMKVFVQQLPQEVSLDELVADNPLVVPMNLNQVEVNWDIVQTEPVGGNRRRQRKQNQGNLDSTTRAVVRRYELYNFTGAYDPITHEALCADLTCSAPGADEIGDFISAQMTAVNVQADWLTVGLVGSGKVQSSDKIIACGSKCSSPYIGGTNVTLTASAASGSTFSGWSGACIGFGTSPTCTVSIAGATTATATFTPTKPSGGGGGGGGTTSTMYTLSVGISNKGLVTSDSGNISCGNGGSCSAKIAGGTAVTLTAVPPSGLAFLGWSGACTGTAPTCSLTLSADTKAQASFSK